MTEYSYAIGSTSTVTNVESLTTPVNPPRGTFQEWTRVYTSSSGMESGDGYPSATWHFDVLTQAMVTQLRSFCSGKSASVYITTRNGAGSFVKYSAVMIWPQNLMDKRVFRDRYLDVEIEFRKLVAA